MATVRGKKRSRKAGKPSRGRARPAPSPATKPEKTKPGRGGGSVGRASAISTHEEATRKQASPKRPARVKSAAKKAPRPAKKPPRKPRKAPARTAKPAKRPAPRPAPAPAKRPPRAPSSPPPRPRAAKPTKAKKPPIKRARVLSQTRDAIRARARRAAEKAKRQSAAQKAARTRAERRALEEARKAEAKQRREAKKHKPDERELAIGWLEAIRDRVSSVFAVSLSITEAEAGARTPWLVVGRFDPTEEIGYQELGEALELCRDDLTLEALIHPQRLSQIRIVYEDPNAKRGEGDSVVSSIGAWEAVISDIVGELVGGDFEIPSEESLAVRYAETGVGMFYVYFSSELQHYETRGPWTVKL